MTQSVSLSLYLRDHCQVRLELPEVYDPELDQVPFLRSDALRNWTVHQETLSHTGKPWKEGGF